MIKKIKEISSQYDYLQENMKAMWTITHDDGEVKFERIMDWLISNQDNIEQMSDMVDLAKKMINLNSTN